MSVETSINIVSINKVTNPEYANAYDQETDRLNDEYIEKRKAYYSRAMDAEQDKLWCLHFDSFVIITLFIILIIFAAVLAYIKDDLF